MNKTGKYIAVRSKALSIYITSDFPSQGDTGKVILELQSAGVDLIEVGIPFSDPLADGPVIQQSSMIALQNGFTLNGLFDQLDQLRNDITIPLIPMGYFNTMLSFGVTSFLKRCQALGIDTVIIPDLPIDVYEDSYQSVFSEYGVSPAFLISPRTSEERIKKIDELSQSFIYIVSDNSITGAKGKMSEAQISYFERVQKMKLTSPTLIGFGIADKSSFEQACRYSNGAIIGSAFIKALSEPSSKLQDSINTFIGGIKSTSKQNA